MTRDRTHYVGDDCPGGHHSAYLPGYGPARLPAVQAGQPTPVDPLGVPCPACGATPGTACTSLLTHPARADRARIVAAVIDENASGDQDGRITEEDVEAPSDAGYRIGGTTEDPDMRAALVTALRPGGLVARAIAAELDRIARDHADGVSLDHFGATLLRGLAASWREGRRQ